MIINMEEEEEEVEEEEEEEEVEEKKEGDMFIPDYCRSLSRLSDNTKYGNINL